MFALGTALNPTGTADERQREATYYSGAAQFELNSSNKHSDGNAVTYQFHLRVLAHNGQHSPATFMVVAGYSDTTYTLGLYNNESYNWKVIQIPTHAPRSNTTIPASVVAGM